MQMGKSGKSLLAVYVPREQICSAAASDISSFTKSFPEAMIYGTLPSMLFSFIGFFPFFVPCFNINADTLQHLLAEPCVIVRHLIILDKAVMLGRESVIELPQTLLAEAKVNMEGVKHHSVNVIGIASMSSA